MSLSWSARRQLIILSGLVALALIAIAIFFVPYVTKAPSCTDGKQNGDETGIDCGGSCPNVCSSDVGQVQVLWARAFPITGSIYNAVAYIENQNVGAGVKEIDYDFRLYDQNNSFITERTGTTFIGKEGTSAIFEGDIDVGTKIPARTTFTFTTSNPIWTKLPLAINRTTVESQNVTLTNQTTTPNLTATVSNTSLNRISGLDVIAIIYGADGNAIGVSKTYLDHLDPGESQEVVFTWPSPFSAMPVKEEIVPRINPFTLDIAPQ